MEVRENNIASEVKRKSYSDENASEIARTILLVRRGVKVLFWSCHRCAAPLCCNSAGVKVLIRLGNSLNFRAG